MLRSASSPPASFCRYSRINWLRLLPSASARFLARSTVCSSMDSVTFMNTVYVRPYSVSRRSRGLGCYAGSRTLRFQGLNNCVRELRCSRGAPDIPRQLAAVAIDLVDGVADLPGGVGLADMAQHEQRGSQHGRGIGYILSGNVGCGTMDSLKDGALMAEIRAGHKAKSADQSRAQIGNNVAVEILQQQHVVLVGVHHQLHASVVDNVLAVGDLGILFRDVARAAQKQAIGQLHDVGFVDAMNFLALVFASMRERETRNARGSLFADHLDALHHSGDNFVLDTGIQSLGIFADHDQVDARVTRRDMRQVAYGPKVGEEFEALAQLDVDAGEAAADRRSHRTLQSDAGALDRFAEFLGNVFVILLKSFGPGRKAFPLKLNSGGFDHANRSLNHFGTDAVAGDEGYFMRSH